MSPEEIEKFDLLMENSEEFRTEVNKTKRIFYLLDNLESQKEIKVEAAWEKLNRKIYQNYNRLRIFNIAKNVAAILLPFFLLYYFVAEPYIKHEESYEIITLYSAPGIVTKTILPDGSEVWLNSKSELSYPSKFKSNERTVQLLGEAYFKVEADDKNVFNVITPNKTVISAYGTEFNVNAYEDNPINIITLASGNVTLNTNEHKKILMPGQKALVDQQNNTIELKIADTYVETAWKDGKLVFRRENINYIADRLAKKFGVLIQVQGDISKNYQFTATFTDESLEDILELLKLSSSIDYSISHRKKLSNNTYSQKIVTLICK